VALRLYALVILAKGLWLDWVRMVAPVWLGVCKPLEVLQVGLHQVLLVLPKLPLLKPPEIKQPQKPHV
jgi:hypothetical protein